MPLNIAIGGDASGFANAMAKAQAIAEITYDRMKTQFAATGRDIQAQWQATVGNMRSVALRGLALGGAAAGVVAAYLVIRQALEQAADATTKYLELQDAADKAGAPVEAYQRWIDLTTKLSASTDELSSALQTASSAFKEGPFGESSKFFKQASEIFMNMPGFQSTAFKNFIMAKDDEERMRAGLEMTRELFNLSRSSEGLGLVETMLGENFANKIRDGRIQLDDLIAKIDMQRAKPPVDFVPEEQIRRAEDLTKRIEDAEKQLNAATGASQALHASSLDIKEAWASILESMTKAVNVLRQVANAARTREAAGIIQGLEQGIERERRIVAGGAPAGRLRVMEAELARLKQVGPPIPSGFVEPDESGRGAAAPAFPPGRPSFDEDKKTGGRKTGSEGSDLDAIERFIIQQKKANEVLAAEAAAFGKSNQEREVAIALIRAHAASQLAETNLTAEQTRKITEQAQARARTMDLQRQQQQFIELQNFAGSQLVDVLDRATEKGAKLSDIMLDVASSFKRAAIQALILGQGPFAGLLGMSGQGGATGGIIGALTNSLRPKPMAEGGPIAAGRPYLVGERGPEIIMPRTAGTVIPSVGGNVTYAPVNTITAAPGVTPAELAAVLDKHDQQFIRRLPQIARSADKRFG